VQLKRGEWLQIPCKRHQIGHLEFSPHRLLTEGFQVRILAGEPNLSITCSKFTFRKKVNCPCFVRVLILAVLLLFAPKVHAQTFRVPFHSVNGMILLDAQVNGKPAVLLLDTGANFTLISLEASGVTGKLDALSPNKTTGATGEYVKGRVDLRMEKRHWIERDVLIMDLSEASKRIGERVDGFIGQDLLQEFSVVRIDYKAGAVEFEK